MQTLTLEETKTLGMLLKEDHEIFKEALTKVEELAMNDPSDPKKWEFVRCHINDAFYDCVWKYDLLPNLKNDLNWYGYKEVCDWLTAIKEAGADYIVKEAIKDYHPEDWVDCSVEEINDDSIEYFRPLW